MPELLSLSKTVIAILIILTIACSRPASFQNVPESQVPQMPAEVRGEPEGRVDQVQSSRVLPATCSLISPDDTQEIFSWASYASDITDSRKEDAPVEHSCLLYFGSEDEGREERRKRRFQAVRVDVYSNDSYSDAGWGTLSHNWQYRTGSSDRHFQLMEGALAGWGNSDHPPDQSLLIHMGEYMLELSYWPPTSFRGSPEANRAIEKMAALIVERNSQGGD